METDGPGKCERTAKAATNRVGRDCDSGNRNFVGDATRRFEESSRWSRGRARPTRTAYVSRRLGDGTGTGTGTRQNEALRARTDCSAATDGPTQRKRRPTPRPTTKGTWRRRFLRAHPPPPSRRPSNCNASNRPSNADDRASARSHAGETRKGGASAAASHWPRSVEGPPPNTGLRVSSWRPRHFSYISSNPPIFDQLR